MTPEALVRFIRQHDPCDATITPDGRLNVTTDEVDTSGNVSRVVETIPATLKATRNWLGY